MGQNRIETTNSQVSLRERFGMRKARPKTLFAVIEGEIAAAITGAVTPAALASRSA